MIQCRFFSYAHAVQRRGFGPRGKALLLASASVLVCGVGSPAGAVLPGAPAVVEIKDTDYPIPAANVYFVAPDGTGSSTNAGTDPSSPWTIAKAFSSTGAPAGATLVFRGGNYRGVRNLALKRFTLQAFPHEQAWIKGSLVVSDWQPDGAAWRTAGWAYSFPPNVGPESIDPAYPLASARDMVFVDNQPKTQVGSRAAVVPGTFFVDAAADILYLGDDPTGKTVEATAYGQPFARFPDKNTAPTGIVIRGLGFAHYADRVEMSSNEVTLENNTFAWNGDAGLWLYLCKDSVLRGNTFSCNGQTGLFGFYCSRLLVENNTLRYNNVEGYSKTWGGCALKIGLAKDVIFQNNLVEHNFGNGIWMDTSNARHTVVRNTTRHNQGFGIFMELDHDCIVAFNLCVDNTWSGIALSDTSNTRVYNNTLVRNGRAIYVKDTERVNDPNDGVSYLDENATDAANGIVWISRNNVIKNNLFSNGRSTTGSLLDAGDGHNGDRSSLQVSASDYNGYYRTSTGTPTTAVRWRVNTWASPTNYPTVAAFRSANTANAAYEANALVIDNVAEPFFWDEANSDFRLKPGSPAVNRGTALPLDIAEAGGVPATPVHLGAFGALASTALTSVADAYVRDGNSANLNFGTATLLLTKVSTPDYNRWSYFTFDTSSVSGPVVNAKLRVYGFLNDTNSPELPVSVYAVAATNWVETTITWNNKPALGAAIGSARVVGTTGQYYEWDLSAYLQSEKAAGRNRVSVAFRNTASSTTLTYWHSKENATNKPQLIVIR